MELLYLVLRPSFERVENVDRNGYTFFKSTFLVTHLQFPFNSSGYRNCVFGRMATNTFCFAP